jgi:hypothetical protein
VVTPNAASHPTNTATDTTVAPVSGRPDPRDSIGPPQFAQVDETS